MVRFSNGGDNESPANANDAFVELLQRGAGYLDVVVITNRTYKDPAIDFDDGRLDVPGSIELFPQSGSENHSMESIPSEENSPQQVSPFGDISGEMWLLDQLRFPGDLSAGMRQLGFSRDIARDIESTVLRSGALVILRVPSGPVDETQGWQALERHGGSIVTPRIRNPYLY